MLSLPAFRRILPCLALCLSFLQTSNANAQTWREVQSPHFRVVTDGSERDGRDVAKEFEQMRSVFAVHFNNPVLDEAVDLGSLLPPAARGEGPPLTLTVGGDLTLVRGTILSSSCEKSGLTLVLQPATPHAAAVKLVATGRFESGFSDTLWVGEDHYTSCFHLAGLPAVVAYKEDAADTKTLRVLEIRDDLPQLGLATPAPTTSGTSAETASPQP